MSPEVSGNDIISIKYIYDLPYDRRKKICNLLDLNDEWKELGGVHMKFDCFTLDKVSKAVYRRESPTEELLQLWGNQNHTIFELFILLRRMKHFQAMKVLQPFVDNKYHCLIHEGVSQLDIVGRFEDKLETLIEFTDTLGRDTGTSRITRRQKQDGDMPSQNAQNNLNKSAENKTDVSGFNDLESCIPFIKYKELELATNFWDRSNILGRGGFGVVFKGTWKQTTVAIKRLEPQKGNEIEFNALEAQRQQSFRELKYLNNSRHDNILPIYGYSFSDQKYCLVYQFMPNGSLEDRIQCKGGSKPLPWFIRYNIATGTARGLQFLHGMDKPLVHGDIKSANILLDHHFDAKIGDFGLAREGPAAQYTHVKVSRVHGTRPYLPDEFLRGKKFSTKVDTYSFGVVLFEIATGLRAYDDSRSDKFLRDYVSNYDEEKLQDLIDPKVGCENFNFLKILIELGKKCVVHRPRDRPEMIEVSKQLDAILADRDSIYKALNNPRLNSSATPIPLEAQLRYEYLTGRRPSLIPPTGSYHPEAWLFVTPPASIQPPSIRRSPSPTNPAVTVQGLKQVSEESVNASVPTTNNCELNQSVVEASAPNFQAVPGIAIIPPDPSASPQKSFLTGAVITSSSIESMSISDSIDESNQQKSELHNYKDNKEDVSELVPNLTIFDLKEGH